MVEPSPPPQPVSLYTFVNNTPAPVVQLLANLAPFIAKARRTAEILSWKSKRTSESWLAIVAWWTLCLSAESSIRYLVPLALLLPTLLDALASRFAIVRRWTQKTDEPPLATEPLISQSLADIDVIQTLLPHPPPLPQLPSSPAIFRIVAVLYVPYVVLVYLLTVRVLVALVGSMLLCWRSPWMNMTRRILSNSGWIQWFIDKSWATISGTRLRAVSVTRPSLTVSIKTQPAAEASRLPTHSHLRFQFVVFENQRWWMGLDFTAALVPGERPSWAGPPPNMAPLPPPGSLSLPGPSTVYLPLDDLSSSSSRRPLRTKKTAQWRWEDDGWGVTVRALDKDGKVQESRHKMEPPSEIDAHATGNASRLVDAVGRGLKKAQTVGFKDNGSPTRDGLLHTTGHHDKDGQNAAEKSQAMPSDTDLTDADGWVYADNKWEGASGLRGRGKYTRYRRWTRNAILEETAEIVDDVPADSFLGPEQNDRLMSSSPVSFEEERPIRRRATLFKD